VTAEAKKQQIPPFGRNDKALEFDIRAALCQSEVAKPRGICFPLAGPVLSANSRFLPSVGMTGFLKNDKHF
jgi:hypothetical protein